jgi:hypothetical protein
VRYTAALALSFAGDPKAAQPLSVDLDKRFPEATNAQLNFLPTLRAALALAQRKPSDAIGALKPIAPYEMGRMGNYTWTAMYPIFVRGQAYLALHQGQQAAAEFQKILDHRGIVLNQPIGALAHLGLARSYALQSDAVNAQAAYQDFLHLWMEADPNIPLLIAAKSENANLHH